MIFSKRKNYHTCDVYFDGEKIQRVSETKFWGVIIDDKLSWKNRALYLCKSIKKYRHYQECEISF